MSWLRRLSSPAVSIKTAIRARTIAVCVIIALYVRQRMMSSVQLLLSIAFNGRRTQIIACFVNPLKCDIATFTYAMVFSGCAYTFGTPGCPRVNAVIAVPNATPPRPLTQSLYQSPLKSHCTDRHIAGVHFITEGSVSKRLCVALATFIEPFPRLRCEVG